MNTSIEELIKIPDIGDIIAKSLVEYFQEDHNKAIIEELKPFQDKYNELLNNKFIFSSASLLRFFSI